MKITSLGDDNFQKILALRHEVANQIFVNSSSSSSAATLPPKCSLVLSSSSSSSVGSEVALQNESDRTLLFTSRRNFEQRVDFRKEEKQVVEGKKEETDQEHNLSNR